MIREAYPTLKTFAIKVRIYNISSNTYKDATINEETNTFAIAQQLNPLDKIVELYERLLKRERGKLEISLRNN